MISAFIPIFLPAMMEEKQTHAIYMGGETWADVHLFASMFIQYISFALHFLFVFVDLNGLGCGQM